MPVRAFLGLLGVPAGLVNFTLNLVAVDVEDTHGVTTHFREIALFEIDESLRDRQQCRNAAGDEVLPDAKPDDQRTGNAANDDTVRIFGIDNQQRIRTFELLDRLANGRNDQIEALDFR